MESISSTHPLQILKELEQTCKRKSTETLKVTPKWSGLGFRIANYKMCIESKYIDEVLDSNFKQNMSSVPGAKKWLSGLISLRGKALPVIDLQQYLLDKEAEHSKKSRLLVIKFSNTKTGLIVDETFGLQQIDKHNTSQINQLRESDSIPKSILNSSDRSFNINNQSWIEFLVPKLENDENFISASRF